MHSLCSLRSPQRSLARASLQSPRLLCSVRSHASPCHTPSVLPASLALGLACRLELPTVTASPAARATFARALPAACACCWRCAPCLVLSLPSPPARLQLAALAACPQLAPLAASPCCCSRSAGRFACGCSLRSSRLACGCSLCSPLTCSCCSASLALLPAPAFLSDRVTHHSSTQPQPAVVCVKASSLMKPSQVDKQNHTRG